jgi:hypothetical protein
MGHSAWIHTPTSLRWYNPSYQSVSNFLRLDNDGQQPRWVFEEGWQEGLGNETNGVYVDTAV